MKGFSKGLLHSGIKNSVKDKKQAISAMYNKKDKANDGKKEHKIKKNKKSGIHTGPSDKVMKRFGK